MTAPPTIEPGAAHSTPRRFLASSLASYWSLGVRLVVGFVSRMVLARLLIPEDHGLYELALRIVTVAGALRDLGLIYHLIRDERRPYGTVLAFTVGSGVAVTGALMIAAPLAGGLDPELPGVLRVFALWVLLDGLGLVPRTYFERELRIGRLMLPEIARGVAVAALAIGLAWLGYGVWSFVVADLAAAAVFAALAWRRAWGRMPLEVDLRLLPSLLRQSMSLFLVWVTLQLVTYVDLFILDVIEDTAMVGQYARAYMIAFLVRQIVFPRALLPALVEYRHDPPRFHAAFRVTTVFLLSCEVTAGYFLFFNAEKVVEVLLGSQWGPAVGILKILCFVPFLDVFSELGGEVLKVRHEDRLWLLIMVGNLASLLVFGIWFTGRWGAEGMAAANFLLLGNLLMAWRMSRVFAGAFVPLLADMALIYLLPLPLFAAAAELPAGSWWRLAASALAALISLALLAWRFWRPFRSFLAERSAGG
jgi:PST family polysaccharide transporter